MRRPLTLLLAALLLAALVSPARAQTPEKAVVRVGVYESNGFIALNGDGEMTGYGAEFMDRLARYANVEYEYVRLTWQGCMDGLLSGEIDIVTDARRTPEREELYDFSVQCIGQIQAAIFVGRGRDDIYFNDYPAMARLRVGFEQGALNRALYEDFARQHGFEADTAEYPSTSDLLAALERGEIDAFGGDTHVYTDELRVISIYNTDPNYIMAAQGSEILERLNLAIEQMYSENPDMIARQYEYLTDRQVYGELLLTRAEAEYIASHPVLRVAAFTDRKPASWYDAESGSFRGIAIDMMEELSGITGIDFEYVPASGAHVVDMLADGSADIAMPTVSAEYYSGGVPVFITDPLFSLSVALVFDEGRREDASGGLTVAVTYSNEGVRDMLAAHFENISFIYFDTAAGCISAVRQGRADAYGNAMYELEYQLKSPRSADMSIAYYYSCPIDYCLALSEGAAPELRHILNGGIALMDSGEGERIIRYHSTFLRYDYTLADRLYENRYLLSASAAVLALVLLGWLLYYRMQRRSMAALELKSEEVRRASAAKSDFLARMSHDMRTPMNGILGLAQLSKDMDMPPPVRDTFSKIESEGHFLLGLINDTLDMSKIENGKLTLSPQPCDSQQLIDDTLTLVDAYARERGVRWSVTTRSLDRRMVSLDKLRVQQIIMNILSNAVKFSPRGGQVEIYAECMERRDGVLHDRFVITDHGPGMSAEFLPRIFEPFEQEKDAAAPRREGSGLGMAITKSLVDMMGGRIQVESAPGVGTRVTVWLDFEECADGSGSAAPADTGDIPPGTPVLLCEDNAMNTLVARGFLQKLGCRVTCAVNGREGLELFRASPVGEYGIILMDIRMPVMDGLEAARAIRSLDRPDAGTVQILALTANAFQEDVQACLDAGMNAHVAKPIDPPQLREALCRALKARGI